MASMVTPGNPLRIVIAEDEPDVLETLQRSVTALGHEVVGTARSGSELVELCRALHPDLVITDIKMPDMDGIDAAMEVYKEGVIPSIVVSGYADQDFAERVEKAPCIYSYLVKPVEFADLGGAISVTIARFRQFEALSEEIVKLRQDLTDRKVIERAKGILMRQARLDEATAYRRLQKISNDKSQKLIEVAKAIILAEEAATFEEPS